MFAIVVLSLVFFDRLVFFPVFFFFYRCEIEVCSHAHHQHQAVADGDNDEQRDDARGDTATDEVLDLEVALARLGVLHHDGRCFGNPLVKSALSR